MEYAWWDAFIDGDALPGLLHWSDFSSDDTLLHFRDGSCGVLDHLRVTLEHSSPLAFSR